MLDPRHATSIGRLEGAKDRTETHQGAVTRLRAGMERCRTGNTDCERLLGHLIEDATLTRDGYEVTIELRSVRVSPCRPPARREHPG